MENIFARTRTTLSRKKTNITKIELQELHCFDYNCFQLNFPIKACRSEDPLRAEQPITRENIASPR